ncbi:MAG TPA: sugar ABC transporter substrate-binding protein [Pseudonocardia sp.]
MEQGGFFRRGRPQGLLVTAAALALALTGCASNPPASSGGGAAPATAGGSPDAKIAFLMPDQNSTRYEEHDAPGFKAELAKICPGCTPLYNNANADANKQQQQFNSAIAQGAKAVVLDPVDSTAAASLVNTAKAQGVKVIAYDRPIPSIPADYYVSFDNEAIGKSIAQSLVQKLKTGQIPAGSGILEVNGSPTDAAAGLIKKGIHEGLDGSGITTLAEFDTPDWTPSKAQDWVAGQITRFGTKIVGVVAANDGTGGGTIAAFKAAGVNPVPPVTGNDATLAGVQLIVAGDQYNTISKPSEIVAAAAADVAVKLLSGEDAAPKTTLFNTPTQLFDPKLITKDNVKTDLVTPGIMKASDICTGNYATACAGLGLS